MIRKSLLLAAALLAGACSRPVPKTFEYKAGMSDALIAFGVAPPSNRLTVNIAAIDPAACRLTNFGGFGDKSYSFNEWAGPATQTRYVVGKFEPGTYVISFLSRGSGVTNLILSLERGSMAFKVNAGDFIYLGDLALAGQQPTHVGFNPAKLRAHLAQYPGLTRPPTDYQPIRTHFAKVGAGQAGTPVAGCGLS
ncbi:MAG TPA: hypothetical protein VF582_06845 [Allosphingosinicella sp.]|jgi:hypothetical protein